MERWIIMSRLGYWTGAGWSEYRLDAQYYDTLNELPEIAGLELRSTDDLRGEARYYPADNPGAHSEALAKRFYLGWAVKSGDQTLRFDKLADAEYARMRLEREGRDDVTLKYTEARPKGVRRVRYTVGIDDRSTRLAIDPTEAENYDGGNHNYDGVRGYLIARAVAKLFGSRCFWFGEYNVLWRGQVFAACDGGGANSQTGVTTISIDEGWV